MSLRAAAALLCMVVLVGCSSDDPPPSPPAVPGVPQAELVEFAASDGVTLTGLLFRPSGATGVIVMAHQRGGSMDDWIDPAVAAAEEGMAALVFDFRHFGGEGEPSGPAPDVDLAAAVEFVRQRGFSQVGVAGASIGATAALHHAAHDDLAAVVALSPPRRFAGLRVRPRRIDEPVLLVTAADDQPYRRQADRLSRRLAAATDLPLSGTAHGTEIFAAHPAFVDHVVDFFSQWLDSTQTPSDAPAVDAPQSDAPQLDAPQPVAPPG